MKKIMIIINSTMGLIGLRKELLSEIINQGYKIVIVIPKEKENNELEGLKVDIRTVSLNRRGKNPFSDIKLYKNYKKIIKKERPDVILTYTIKPNIYGGIAAKKLKVPYIANITGLGTAVENGGILQKITTFLYKKAFKNINTVFFQNQTNMNFFIENKIALGKHKLIPGSGVNLKYFEYIDYPKNDKVINVLYIGRLMTDKGTTELLKAIEIIKKNNININFDLIGFAEEDNFLVRIKSMEEENLLKYHGLQKDVRPFLKKAHVLVNPTYHEGLSNVLLEASASGRPVLASKVPGCIETFDEGLTGIGFEPRSVDSLVEAINKFAEIPYEKKVEMGKNARLKVEKEYDRNIVVNASLKEIENILN